MWEQDLAVGSWDFTVRYSWKPDAGGSLSNAVEWSSGWDHHVILLFPPQLGLGDIRVRRAWGGNCEEYCTCNRKELVKASFAHGPAGVLFSSVVMGVPSTFASVGFPGPKADWPWEDQWWLVFKLSGTQWELPDSWAKRRLCLRQPRQEDGMHAGRELWGEGGTRLLFPSWGIYLLWSRHFWVPNKELCLPAQGASKFQHRGGLQSLWSLKDWKNYICLGWDLGYTPLVLRGTEQGTDYRRTGDGGKEWKHVLRVGRLQKQWQIL